MSASPYGLSIVLDFEDNASEGMRNATNAFSGLSGSITNLEAGIGGTSDSLLDLNTSVVGMSVMGSQLQNVGSGLLGTLKGVSESVIETSSSFENFDITLQALYKSEEEASNITDKLFKYASKSPFQVQDLQSMVVTLKSQGLEAFNELQGAQTGLKQTTMDWIGDLQAFRPGETALKWKRAIQNFLSGTNNKSAEMLRNILDVGKLDDFLGHDLHTTVEGRMQDLMEIVEKTGMAGMQNKLSKTWSVVISNMEDTWSQFAYRIGFGNKENSMYKSATNSARNLLMAMTEVLGNNDFIKATSDAFLSLISPIERVTEAVAMAGPALGNFLGQHPKIAKMATSFTAVGGAAIWATGTLLKMSAGALNWLLNVQRLGGLSGIFNMLSNAVNMLSLRMVGLGAVGGLVYAAWKGDFLGLRTLITRFTGQFGEIFKKTYNDMFPNEGKGKTFFESLEGQGLSKFVTGLKSVGSAAKEMGKSFREGVSDLFKFFGVNLPSLNAETFSLKNTLNDLGDSLVGKLGGNAEKFKEKWGGLLSTTGKVVGAFGSAIGVVTLLGGAIKMLGGAGGILATNLKIIGSTLVSPTGLLGLGLTGLILGYQNDFLGLQSTVTPIVDSFQAKMKQLKESFGQKNSEGRNTVFETIKNKMTELNKALKEWRTDGEWDYIDGSSMVKHQVEQGKSIGQVLAQGIASGLIAFGSPIQKALGATMWAFATDIGGIRKGTESMVSQLINAKDLLLEMSTGYGPKSHALAEKFGLQEFADGMVNIKNTSMSFLKSFMNGFAKSNTIIGKLVKDLFPDLDFSVNGILNAVGRLGTKISNFMGLDDKGNIADNFAQIAEKLGDMAAKAMLVAPAFAALKTAMNFGVNPLGLAGITQSFGLIQSGISTTISGLLSGSGSIITSITSLGFKVAGIWRFALQSALLQDGNNSGILSGIKNSLTKPFTSAFSTISRGIKNTKSNWSIMGNDIVMSWRDAFSSRIPIAWGKFSDSFKSSLSGLKTRWSSLTHSLAAQWESFRLGLQRFPQTLGKMKSSIGSFFKNGISQFKDLPSEFKESILETLSSIKDAVADTFSSIGKGIKETYNNVSQMIADNKDKVLEVFSNFKKGATAAFASILTSLQGAKLQVIFEVLKSGVSMFASAVAGAVKMVIGLNGVAVGLATVTSLILAFGTITMSDWSELGEVIKEQPTLLGKAGAAWDWFNGKLAGTTTKVNEFISKFDTSKLVGKVVGTISKLGDSLASIIGGSNGNNGLADAGGRLLSQLVDGMANNTNIGNSLQRILNSVTNAIQKYAPKIGMDLGNAIGKAFEWVGNNADKIFDSAFTIMRSFMNGLLNNKDKIVTGAINIVKSLATHVKENAPYIIGAARELINGFVDGLSQNKELIGEAFNSVIGPIYNIVQENLPKVCELAGSVLSGLWNTIKSAALNALADILQGISIFMGAIDAVSTAVGALMMLNPLTAEVGGTLMFKGISGLIGDTGLLGASGVLRHFANEADEANKSMWKFNDSATLTTDTVSSLDKALETIGNRETTFKIKKDGSVEELTKDLNQLELKTAHGNNEIIYKTVLTGEGEVEAKAFEVKAIINSDNEIEYVLVAKEDGDNTGKSLVDANVNYAESNPMKQELQIVQEDSGGSDRYNLKYNSNGTVAGYDILSDSTDPNVIANITARAEQEVSRIRAIESYVKGERERLNYSDVFNPLMREKITEFGTGYGTDLNNFWIDEVMGNVSTNKIGKYQKEFENMSTEVCVSYEQAFRNAYEVIETGVRGIYDKWTELESDPTFLAPDGLEAKVKEITDVSSKISEIQGKSPDFSTFMSGLSGYADEINSVLETLNSDIRIKFNVEEDENGNWKVTVQELKDADGTEANAKLTVEESGAEEASAKIDEASQDRDATITTTVEGGEVPEEATKPEVKPIKCEYKVDKLTWDGLPQNGSAESTKTLTVNILVTGKENLETAVSSFNGLPKEDYNIKINVVTGDDSLSVISNTGNLLSGLPKELNISVNVTVNSETVVSSLTNAINSVPLNTTPRVEEQGALASTVRVNSLTRAINDVPISKTVAVTAEVSGLSEVQALGSAISNLSGKTISVKAKSSFGGFFAEGGTIPNSDYQIMNEQGGEIVDLPTGSRVYPHDDSLDMSYRQGMSDSLKATTKLIAKTVPTTTGGIVAVAQAPTSQDSYDYSVHFGEGSIVVKVDNAKGDTDYKSAADKIWYYIQQKQKRDKMARRA